jgi:hypothetical protein
VIIPLERKAPPSLATGIFKIRSIFDATLLLLLLVVTFILKSNMRRYEEKRRHSQDMPNFNKKMSTCTNLRFSYVYLKMD